MSPDAPDDDIRVGTPEKERAIALLNDAFSAGYLEIHEFEERSGEVYSARTRADLRSTMRDLPNNVDLFGIATPVYRPAVDPSEKPLKLDADWDSKRRKGSWKVPRQIVATGELGTINLDFTHGRFVDTVAELGLQVSGTYVKLRIGPDQQIRVDELSTSGMSKIADKSGEPRRPGGPLIVLTGHLSALSYLVIKRS